MIQFIQILKKNNMKYGVSYERFIKNVEENYKKIEIKVEKIKVEQTKEDKKI